MTSKLFKVSATLLGMFFTCSAAVVSVAEAAAERKTLKVCADPNYMPFSHKDKSGYENQIADLIASELNLSVDYTWFPQRMGFIRNTLKKKNPLTEQYRCDLVMGVPKEFDFAKATIPYMHSTYALVMLQDGKLKDLKQGNDLVNLSSDQIKDLKIGITERSPGALWLSRYSLYEQMAPYIAQSGDPDEFPNEPMYTDLKAGKIDAAIVWGPTAAYFSRLDESKIKLLPLNSEPSVRFDFFISTAVRYGNDEWKEQVETILKNKSDDINQILINAGIPLLANSFATQSNDD